MSVHETRHCAGDCIGAHRHDFAYAALVLEGGYEEAGPDGVWRLEAGDLVLHPPFHMHANRFTRSDARVLNVMMPHAAARGAARYAVRRPCDPDHFVRSAHRDAAEAFAEALHEAEERAPAPARDWLDAFAAALTPSTRVGALARRFGVTPTYAARAFARRFGLTPAAFRAEQRLRAGLQAVAAAQMSLASIAAACGFADQAHFTRTCVTATGQTPAQLRRAFG